MRRIAAREAARHRRAERNPLHLIDWGAVLLVALAGCVVSLAIDASRHPAGIGPVSEVGAAGLGPATSRLVLSADSSRTLPDAGLRIERVLTGQVVPLARHH